MAIVLGEYGLPSSMGEHCGYCPGGVWLDLGVGGVALPGLSTCSKGSSVPLSSPRHQRRQSSPHHGHESLQATQHNLRQLHNTLVRTNQVLLRVHVAALVVWPSPHYPLLWWCGLALTTHCYGGVA